MDDIRLRSVFFFGFSVLLATNAALDWSPTPRDHSVVNATSGTQLNLPWAFTLKPGEQLTSIVWNFQGPSQQEMVAMEAQGNFIPLAAFSHRVTFTPPAGITLDHVTMGDRGNYSVTVSYHNGNGTVVEAARHVTVEVTDSPLTMDHDLHVEALDWSPTPHDHAVVYACTGTQLTLPWAFTMEPGGFVSSIIWNFQGPSQQEMVAMEAQGNFIPLPAFSHRVNFASPAGITLNNVTMGDRGNYSVTVSFHNGNGTIVEATRHVTVEVADSLMTVDHELHAQQLAKAEFSPLTQQFHSVLTCGQFTFHSDPPVSVEWLTPDGQTLNSTRYSQGHYDLLLSNPVTPGNYTCKISEDTKNVSCGGGQGQVGTVEVKAMDTRLILMEAVITQLTSSQHGMQAELNKTKMENAALQNKVQGLENDLATVKNHTAPLVSFTARLTSAQQLGSSVNLVLNDVLENRGHAYDPSTGMFTAPVNGTYVFFASAAATQTSRMANFVLRWHQAGAAPDYFVDLFYTAAHNDGYWQSGSLQGSVRMSKGDTAWLVSVDDNNSFKEGEHTSFSGFLLFLDF